MNQMEVRKMGYLSERVSYLRGLADGMKLNEDTNEGRLLKEIIEVLPGMKSPTVMPLAQEGWCSVHTVLDEKRFWDIIGKLKVLGAEGILVLPIEKMIV